MRARTRIKICGLTRADDVVAALDAGVDALGLVFYPPSARYLTPAAAAALLNHLPPLVTTVGLFVNASAEQVAATVARVPLTLLQFHGDETLAWCSGIAARLRLPFLRALRVGPAARAADLLECELAYRAGSPWFAGLLLDADSDAYGGSGKVFDWSVIPEELARRVVLSGGLNARNVTDAVAQLHPYAVDVSSGVERQKGIKDAARIHAFVTAVRHADAAVLATESTRKQP